MEQERILRDLLQNKPLINYEPEFLSNVVSENLSEIH